MSGQRESWRRLVAVVTATATCLAIVGLVAGGIWFLERARGLERTQDVRISQDPPASPASLVPTSHRAASVKRHEPAFTRTSPRIPPPVRRRIAAYEDAVAAVMSANFPFRRAVLRAAKRHEVDPHLVFAIIASESRGDPEAVSPSGAIGLMQLMPTTADELGVDPWKPEENIDGAVRYLALLLQQFGSVDLSLVAYNAGPGFAERYRQGEVDLGAETRGFIMRVAGLQ